MTIVARTYFPLPFIFYYFLLLLFYLHNNILLLLAAEQTPVPALAHYFSNLFTRTPNTNNNTIDRIHEEVPTSKYEELPNSHPTHTEPPPVQYIHDEKLELVRDDLARLDNLIKKLCMWR
jgi:hypothetical protein